MAFKLPRFALAAVSVLTVTPLAWSQQAPGTITYGPSSATAVTTVGDIGLILLAALLALVAWWAQRNGLHRRSPMLGLALAVAVFAFTAGRFALVEAGVGQNTISLDQPGGGTVELEEDANLLKNATQGPLQIVSIDFNEGFSGVDPLPWTSHPLN